jgi:flavin reductase (DIM6/NTAB) family NADH-FMN oxidoreductase RutF
MSARTESSCPNVRSCIMSAIGVVAFSAGPGYVNAPICSRPVSGRPVSRFSWFKPLRASALLPDSNHNDSDEDIRVLASPSFNVPSTPAPWQLIPSVCYAVATYSNELGRGNFNIATYVTPCGLGTSPKFAVAFYVGTLSWTTVKQTGVARLVVLAERHAALVPLFGRRCGRDVDKLREALTLGFDVSETDDRVPFLPDSPGFVDIKVDEWIDCGDHELAVCSTMKFRSLRDEVDIPVLTTSFLHKRSYI